MQTRWTEAAGAAHLVWDARREPIVGVTHVSRDGARTVVAPRLEGGEASFSTTGLPAGGHFEVSYASPLSARLALMQR